MNNESKDFFQNPLSKNSQETTDLITKAKEGVSETESTQHLEEGIKEVDKILLSVKGVGVGQETYNKEGQPYTVNFSQEDFHVDDRNKFYPPETEQGLSARDKFDYSLIVDGDKVNREGQLDNMFDYYLGRVKIASQEEFLPKDSSTWEGEYLIFSKRVTKSDFTKFIEKVGEISKAKAKEFN